MVDVERVDFVSVPTRDAERSRRFYGELLGLPTRDPDEFETANVTLALWQPEAEGVAFSSNTAGIALRVLLTTRDGNVLILHRRYAPRSRNATDSALGIGIDPDASARQDSTP